MLQLSKVRDCTRCIKNSATMFPSLFYCSLIYIRLKDKLTAHFQTPNAAVTPWYILFLDLVVKVKGKFFIVTTEVSHCTLF